jgi:hypothetical protein
VVVRRGSKAEGGAEVAELSRWEKGRQRRPEKGRRRRPKEEDEGEALTTRWSHEEEEGRWGHAFTYRANRPFLKLLRRK